MFPPRSLRRWAPVLAAAGALLLSAAPGAAAARGPHLSYTGAGPGARIEVNGPVAFDVAGMRAGTDEVTVTSPALVEPRAPGSRRHSRRLVVGRPSQR
ncbi:hypothetical protein GCM10010211_45980 [Streptomyces albospinus]|uniref:Uncharacterized protein n=1 Tax=Streptomyces albospinus TaxID=285515 RepID=A0ABQ2VAX7_9ACTN|nr:hypothetical protein GCM10010211_45980 [Streptomyces albospinus]